MRPLTLNKKVTKLDVAIALTTAAHYILKSDEKVALCLALFSRAFIPVGEQFPQLDNATVWRSRDEELRGKSDLTL